VGFGREENGIDMRIIRKAALFGFLALIFLFGNDKIKGKPKI